MYCQKCGTVISGQNATACSKCGNPTTQPVAAAPQTQAAYLPASMGRRLANYCIDAIIIYVLEFIIGFFIGFATAASGRELNFALPIFVSLLTFAAYYLIMESAWQRTVGKFVTGTKVVAMDGSAPTGNQLLIRTLSRFVPFEAFSFLAGSNPIGWHDRWSGTMVVPAEYSPEMVRMADSSKEAHSRGTAIAIIVACFMAGVAVVGIFSAIVLASLSAARGTAVDMKRVSDMHRIQIALELYEARNGAYPQSLQAIVGNRMLASLPTDPTSSSSYDYYLCSPSKYHLGASLDSRSNAYLRDAANGGTICEGDTVAGRVSGKCSPNDPGSFCFDVVGDASSTLETSSWDDQP